MKVYGPYLRKDGRKHVIIIHDNKRVTKSWPRYLMEQYLGRELRPEETVDHIDNDFTNDSLSNLQILTLKDNVKKQHNTRKEEVYVAVVCKNCGKLFNRRKKLIEYNINVLKKDGPYCSHKCVGMVHN